MTEHSDESKAVERLYATTDAAVWAEEFLAVVEGGADVDFGLVVGWFANAMATQERHTLDTHPERKRASDQDFVVLPREPLFEFLGEMALPPWTDADGSIIGGGIDCAPIASRLIEWVDQHDLGDLYGAHSDSSAPTGT